MVNFKRRMVIPSFIRVQGRDYGACVVDDLKIYEPLLDPVLAQKWWFHVILLLHNIILKIEIV